MAPPVFSLIEVCSCRSCIPGLPLSIYWIGVAARDLQRVLGTRASRKEFT